MAAPDQGAIASGADHSRYDLRRRNHPAVEVNDVTVLPARNDPKAAKPRRRQVCAHNATIRIRCRKHI